MAKSVSNQDAKELLDDELDQVNGGVGNHGTTYAANNFQGAMNFQNANTTKANSGIKGAFDRFKNGSILKNRGKLSGAQTMSELTREEATKNFGSNNRFQGNNAGGTNNGGTRFDQNQ